MSPRAFRPLLAIIVACAATGACRAREHRPSAADQALAAAQKTYDQEGPKAALPQYERVLELYRSAHDRRGEAITLGYIGNCYKKFGDFPRALSMLGQALAIKRAIGDRLEEGKTLSNLGLVYWEQGDYPKAIEHFNQSVAIGAAMGDRRLEGSALNNLGLVSDEQGTYTRSLDYYKRALALHRASGFAMGESDTLGNIGGVNMLLGRYAECADYYRQALAIDERLGLKPRSNQDVGNLALCQSAMGEVDAALASFSRALKLAADAGLMKDEADWHRGKGSALARIGRMDQAFAEHGAALATYERAGLKRELIEALNDRGTLESSVGDVASAERDFRRAIELARAIDHPRGVTETLIALGSLEWRRRRFDQALQMFGDARDRARTSGDRSLQASAALQLALARQSARQIDDARTAAREGFELARELKARPLEAEAMLILAMLDRADKRYGDAIAQLDAGDQVAAASGDPDVEWRLSFERGRTLEARHQYEEAVRAYRRAIGVIEQVRDELSENRYRAGYLEDKHQVYSALVRLLMQLQRPGEAFEYAERLRARSYFDALAAVPPVGSDPARARREAALRSQIRQLQTALRREGVKPSEERHADAEAMFSTELASAERAYAALLDDMRRITPAEAALRDLHAPSAAEVQQRLGPDAALVEYVTGEDGVEAFVLTRKSLRTARVDVSPDALEAKVELLRDLIVRADSDDWTRPARSLYDMLFAPLDRTGALGGIGRLYVVPHGVLHYLPFAALVRSNPQGPHPLVDDFTVSYLPAAAALVHAGSPRPILDDGVLAMAPSRPRLPFAQQEAAAVKRDFHAPSLALVGGEATEASFKRRAGGFRVLHLATHGFFDKMNPLFSGLELEPDEEDDGTLRAYEIQGLSLDADLVTLSACDTALGAGMFSDIPAGEDFVGLIRAFLSAGSASVLATLWHVDDRSTLDVMQEFYGRLGNTGEAAALAEAQRVIRRRGGRYEHPYFWAPFVLVGGSGG